jgi:protein-S-isoprenylcysteine O-methyltransferase Ste14
MSTTQLIVFISGTILIILFSWFVSLREKRYHGIPRFFAFECLLLMGLLQIPVWFKNPFAFYQLISWILLLISIYYVIAAVMLYHRYTNHGRNFENSTRLVTTGLYRYIRHPMYGSLLFLGWGMFLKEINPITVMVILIITIALFITCKVEEKEMKKKFGEEYKEYMKKTKMWIPGVI